MQRSGECSFKSLKAANFTVHLKKKRQLNAFHMKIHLQIHSPLRWSGEMPKNATNANMPFLGQAIWGDLWKSTMEKSRTNATCVTLHPLGHAIWGHIWKTYWRKVKKCNECDLASFQANILTRHLNRYSVNIHRWEKSNKCDQCLLPGKRFEETFKDAQWRKVKQIKQCDYAYFRASDLKKHLKMHSGEKSNKCNQCKYTSSQVSGKQFDKTFKYTQWRKVKQM